MDQGPRSNFEMGGGGWGRGKRTIIGSIMGGGEHKIPFLTESL